MADDPEGKILFVHSGTVIEIFLLLEDFFVSEGVACPSNIPGASTSTAPLVPITPIILEDPSDDDAVLLDDPLSDDASHCPFE